MIDKISSSEMNAILDNTVNDIKTIKTELDNIDSNMQKKFIMMKNEQDFSLSKMADIKTLLTNSSVIDYTNKIVFGNTNISGQYDSYGCCIHPKMSSTPINMFNFMTEDGPFFKNNAVIKINNAIDLDAKESLKHDQVTDKDIYFKEYDSADLTFEITVDTGKLVGETKCNMIELAPFIAGSFEIIDISILSKEDQLTGGTIPVTVIQGLGEIGHTRIMLNSTYNIYKIVFTIKLLYKNANNKYPFGLRHIYFYNASFTSDSYVIAKIEKDKYIDSVEDDIIITTQNNKDNKSATDYGITLYLNNDNNALSNQLDISTDSITNSWARETKTFYTKIPLMTSLYALQFLSINTR